MKRKAIVGLVLIVLFLVSAFLMSTFRGAADSHGISRFLGSQSTVHADSTNLTSSAPISKLSWTQGEPLPVINGRVIFPTVPPSTSTPSYTHWYAGSIYPSSLPTQYARTISMSIMVPPSAPRSDEFYYVILSAWDSNGSYNQIGFSDDYGTWGLTYSWTTGPPDNLTYNYSPNAIALSLGVTYTFNITTQSGVTRFAAYQGSNLVWSLDAPTGGDYLVLSYLYAGYYDYTDYEEVWFTATPGGSPAFNFYFYNNYWISTIGVRNPTTWTPWYAWDNPFQVPSDVNVVISGDSVLVKNPGERWPMFHHDLGHNGYSTSTAPNTNQTLWKYTTGAWVDSSPAVADGMVFVGSWDDKVYALDEFNGTLKWAYATGDVIRSSPAVADGMVFVGSNDKKVYALNETTGTVIWSYTTGNSIQVSSPAVADGKVFIGSTDGGIYALREADGAGLWSRFTGDTVQSSPAVADGIVFVASCNGKVYAFDESGNLMWSYPTGSIVVSSPTVADHRVFIGCHGGKVYAFDESSGSLIWSYQMSGLFVYSSPAVADGMVFVGSLNDKVYALDESTGTLIWSYAADIGFSSPAVADGKVFIGSKDTKVYAFNEFNGTVIWNYMTGASIDSSPAVADGMVFVGSGEHYPNGTVYAFGPVHDVAVTNVRLSKTVVGQGYSLKINVTGANQGSYTETFNVTVYANTTAIATQTGTLTSGSSTTITFTWNTAGFAKGSYTISAYASPVPGETDTTDNLYVDGTVQIYVAHGGGPGAKQALMM